ncbi:MAG: ammonia-forming cytochrome c nitrite reductase subunit c552 [Kofleriaceae bacterium]
MRARRQLWIVLAVACACADSPRDPPAGRAIPARGSVTADSTIAARDYIGPAACGECHPDEHGRWTASLHRVMNQQLPDARPLGDFDHAVVAYAGGEARFDGATMTLAHGERSVRYRVTRTIGVRGLQEYVGIEDGSSIEVRLPFGWWPRRGGWYPQPYFDPWLAEAAFDAYAPVREPWAERCPWCHSTYPFEDRIARASGTKLGHGLERHYEVRVIPADRGRLETARQVTPGISCESCHLGGRAHAEGAPIHLVPIGAQPRPGAPAPTTFADERRDPEIVNAVCAQCHSGPSPHFPDGSATRNSSEALELLAGACRGTRCVDCHDPHRADSRRDTERALAACTRCHDALAEPTAARSHAGHDAVSCLDCHMPQVTMGIDRVVRSHRISSPGDARMLKAAAPNACNLCHLDRTLRWTVDELAARHDLRFDVKGWPALDDNVGETWLASAEPAVRLVAMMAYARSPLGRGMLPQILRGLDDPLAYMRVWTVFAVEDVLGRKLRDSDYDPRAPAANRRRQLAKLRASAGVRR